MAGSERRMLGAQHDTHLVDRAQGFYPAATMRFNGHREEHADERLDRGRAGGAPDARRSPHEAPGSAIKPAERTTGQQYSHRVSWLGRDAGRLSLSEYP